MKSMIGIVEAYNRENEQAAHIILQDVAKYGGETSGAVQWAKTFLARLERERAASCGPLFK